MPRDRDLICSPGTSSCLADWGPRGRPGTVARSLIASFNVPPYQLKPKYMHFYAIGGTDNPIEMVLEYLEDEPALSGWARTYWHWGQNVAAITPWAPLDREEAWALMVRERGEAAAKDEIHSLKIRVSNQLPPTPAPWRSSSQLGA